MTRKDMGKRAAVEAQTARTKAFLAKSFGSWRMANYSIRASDASPIALRMKVWLMEKAR